MHSPDAVRLELPLAGPTSRMLAYAIDALIVWALFTAGFFLLMLSTPWLERLSPFLEDLGEALTGDPGSAADALVLAVAILLLLGAFAEFLYFVFWEAVSRGRSPGKRVVGLRVMRDGGLPLTLGASLARNLLRVVDVLPSSYLVGLVSMLVTAEGKRLGDLAAGTVVVRLDRPPVVRPLDAAPAPGATVFAFRREQVARLGEAERALVRQTLRRLEDLSVPQAGEALERAVEALRERIGFDEPVAAADREAFLRALWEAATARRV